MGNNNLFKTTLFFLVYIVVGLWMIAEYPDYLPPRESGCYIFITFSYFLVAGTLFVTYIFKGLDIFEPIVLITFIYLIMFCITPIINLIAGDTRLLGVDVMDGCIRGTVVFLLSYFSFYIGYYCKKTSSVEAVSVAETVVTDMQKLYITRISLFIWMLCYAAIMLYTMRSGKSFIYVVSIGMSGGINEALFQTRVDFFGVIGYAMVPSFLYIWIYHQSKALKLLLGVLTLSSFVVIGFRFIIIILVFAPIVFAYIKKNTRPKVVSIVMMLLVVLVMINIVGFIRDNIRAGKGVQWDSFNYNFVTNTIKGNFDNVYMPFYGLVDAVPERHDYTWGQQFLYTGTMLVPRALWPEKPMPLFKELVATAVSDYAVIAGVALPNIGEYYAEFGIAGCIICMFVFGYVFGWCTKLYQMPIRNDHALIAYSIIFPASMQLVIRGYTSSNFYLMVFLLSPVVLINWLVKRKAARIGSSVCKIIEFK